MATDIQRRWYEAQRTAWMRSLERALNLTRALSKESWWRRAVKNRAHRAIEDNSVTMWYVSEDVKQ